MIPYVRDARQSLPSSSVKIIGLGGAGANMLERVALDGMDGAELLALNTDLRTLGASIATEKIQLGQNLTKGLGAGGDPELGHQAVLEAEEAVRAALQGRRIVFLCTGLGGGTGSGAAPIVCRIAREEGAFVVVFATMPFAFEGRRRREQAETALNELAVLSNALVTFDNNRMGELVLAKQGIHEAFAAADLMICESIKAVIRLVVRPGLINVGLDDLMSALRTTRSRCLFGSGIAQGKDRSSRALRNALASPLLDQGALLREARTVLVHVSGGEDLTLFEIETLMQRLQKFVPPQAHVLFGAAIDPAMGDSLSITLISALPEDSLATATRDSLSHRHDAETTAPPEQRPSPEPAPTPEPRPAALDTPAAVEIPTPPPPSPTPDPAPAAPAAATPEPSPAPAAPPEPAAPVPPAEPVPPVSRLARTRPDPAPTQPDPLPLFEADRPFAEPVASPAADLDDDDSPFVRAEVVKPQPRSSQTKPRETETAAERPSPVAKAEFIPPRPKSSVVSKLWGKEDPGPLPPGFPPDPDPVPSTPASHKDAPATSPAAASPAPSEPLPAPAETTEPAETPRLRLGGKTQPAGSELPLDSAPRGRFEGESPNLLDGEDLDLPPFLRQSKRKS
jgi:cell division protein FtsZ